jgi:tripartite-type tricarboxylate transporter receptor subunit TctC
VRARLTELGLDLPSSDQRTPEALDEASVVNGLGAQRKTPPEIITKLNSEINAALADPNIKARLADLGSSPLPVSPAEYGRMLAEETDKWAKVIKFAGIKAE